LTLPPKSSSYRLPKKIRPAKTSPETANKLEKQFVCKCWENKKVAAKQIGGNKRTKIISGLLFELLAHAEETSKEVRLHSRHAILDYVYTLYVGKRAK